METSEMVSHQFKIEMEWFVESNGIIAFAHDWKINWMEMGEWLLLLPALTVDWYEQLKKTEMSCK